jgi:hypothetical protein
VAGEFRHTGFREQPGQRSAPTDRITQRSKPLRARSGALAEGHKFLARAHLPGRRSRPHQTNPEPPAQARASRWSSTIGRAPEQSPGVNEVRINPGVRPATGRFFKRHGTFPNPWIRLHLGCSQRAAIVTSAEGSDDSSHLSPWLPRKLPAKRERCVATGAFRLV